jgi:hypothetical protein
MTVFLAIMIVVGRPDGAPPAVAQMFNTSLLGSIASGEVKSQVEIDAAPELVWAVLTDLPSYPVWNPFIYPVEGELRPGSELQITMHRGTGAATYRATVLVVERNHVLSWSGHVLSRGVYDTIYSFSIEPVQTGRVRLISRETRTGLAPIVEWLLGSEIQAGLDAMTRSARNRVDLLRIAPVPSPSRLGGYIKAEGPSGVPQKVNSQDRDRLKGGESPAPPPP